MVVVVHSDAVHMEEAILAVVRKDNLVGKNSSNNLEIVVFGKKQKMKYPPGLEMKKQKEEESSIDVCRIWKKVAEVWKIMDKADMVVRLHLPPCLRTEGKAPKHTGDLMIGSEKIFQID